MNGARAAELLAECANRAAAAAAPGGTLYLGLCCTHYGYVAEGFAAALAARAGRPVAALDPNLKLVESLLAADARAAGGGPVPAGDEAGAAVLGDEAAPSDNGGAADEAAVGCARPQGVVHVAVLSNVELSETARTAFARLVEPVSPATAAALLSYARL